MLALFLLLPLALASEEPAASKPTLPFKVELEEVQMHRASPALHSFVVAPAGDRFLLMGGRIGGQHGFAKGANNFPPAQQNRSIFLFDPAAGTFPGSLDTGLLGAALADALSATNAQECLAGTAFYVIGGYGVDSSNGSMVSFDTVTRFDPVALADLIAKGVKDPAKLRPLFSQGHDPRFKVSGGALRPMGGQLALVFGHQFDGMYSSTLAGFNQAGGMQQRYSEKVRVFTLANDLSVTAMAEFGPFASDLPFHRRDMNVSDRVRPDGTFGLTVYGGVFRAGQIAAHLKPVDIDPIAGPTPGLSVAQVGTFLQATNHYECPGFTIYDASSSTHYTTLLGGISQYRVETKGGVRLVRDPIDLNAGRDGLPFVNTVSTIVRSKDGTTAQYLQPFTLPALLGTSGSFLPSSKAPHYANGVIQLDALKGRTLVGFMYGGIEASASYRVDGPTEASRRLFRIWITPGKVDVTALPSPPA